MSTFLPGQDVRVHNPPSAMDEMVGTVLQSYTNDLGDWVRVDFNEPHFTNVPMRPGELKLIQRRTHE